MGLRRGVLVVLAAAVVLVPLTARAEGDLSVTRDEGAMRCPDGEALGRLARASYALSLPPPAHVYSVFFERSGGAYRAEIVDDTAGRTRRLEDNGTSCAALAHAAAVVLATMWGSEHDEPGPSPPAVVPAPPAAQAPPPPAAPEPSPDERSARAAPGSSPSRRPRGVFGVGGALAVAVVRPVAPALFAEAGLQIAHASLAAGVLWIPTQTIAVAPGTIGVRLVAGSLRGCAFLGDATELGLCAKLFAGQLHAAGAGYDADAQGDRPWFALEPAVFVERSLVEPIRVRADAGIAIPLHAEAFDIRGGGVAYDTPAVGGLFALAIELVTR
jgi:hypothetical protein